MDWIKNGIGIGRRDHIENWVRKVQGMGLQYQDAEDLVHDCILKILILKQEGKLPDLDDPKRIHAFFSRALSNAAIDSWRRSRRGHVPKTGLNQLPDHADSHYLLPEEQAELREELDLLENALAQLDTVDRELLRMQFEEELHRVLIAEKIGVKSERTVRNRTNQLKAKVSALIWRERVGRRANSFS